MVDPVRTLVGTLERELASVPGVPAAVPAVFFVGMASVLYLTATTTIVLIEAQAEMHGRVLALQMVLMAGTAPIGGPPGAPRCTSIGCNMHSSGGAALSIGCAVDSKQADALAGAGGDDDRVGGVPVEHEHLRAVEGEPIARRRGLHGAARFVPLARRLGEGHGGDGLA